MRYARAAEQFRKTGDAASLYEMQRHLERVSVVATVGLWAAYISFVALLALSWGFLQLSRADRGNRSLSQREISATYRNAMEARRGGKPYPIGVFELPLGGNASAQ